MDKYVYFESLVEKQQICKNNPKKSFTREVNKHTVCGFAICISK